MKLGTLYIVKEDDEIWYLNPNIRYVMLSPGDAFVVLSNEDDMHGFETCKCLTGSGVRLLVIGKRRDT